MPQLKFLDTGVGSVNQFYPQARSLRKSFDEIFKDPLSKPTGRFVWDAWNVPNQYSHLRTPLTSFFDENQISHFLDNLSKWAQNSLGLSSISYPWMSAYLDSHYQGLHTDANHGPWAFVYSLTPDLFFEKFRGGRTRLARTQSFKFYSPQTLNSPKEEKDFWLDIEPRFNQLTLFDPRRPHGVQEVRGPQDIREARLVIHGWFSDPRPFYSGDIKNSQAQNLIQILAEKSSELLKSCSWHGLMPLRLNSQLKLQLLPDQLIDLKSEAPLANKEKIMFIRRLKSKILPQVTKVSQSIKSKDFSVTLPLEITL